MGSFGPLIDVSTVMTRLIGWPLRLYLVYQSLRKFVNEQKLSFDTPLINSSLTSKKGPTVNGTSGSGHIWVRTWKCSLWKPLERLRTDAKQKLWIELCGKSPFCFTVADRQLSTIIQGHIAATCQALRYQGTSKFAVSSSIEPKSTCSSVSATSKSFRKSFPIFRA